jgi:hypothetical protein
MQLLEPQVVDLYSLRNYDAIAALQNTPDYFRTPAIDGKKAADIALKACFDSWISIPVCHLFYMPVSAFMHITMGVVILLRRSRLKLLSRYGLKDPRFSELNNNMNLAFMGVDAGTGSDDLMLDLLDRLASRCEEARIEMASAHCAEWSNDFLDLLSWKLRERKGCTEKWVDIIGKDAQQNALDGGGDGQQQQQRWNDLMYGSEGVSTAFQDMYDSGFWLDPLEYVLFGGEEHWFSDV